MCPHLWEDNDITMSETLSSFFCCQVILGRSAGIRLAGKIPQLRRVRACVGLSEFNKETTNLQRFSKHLQILCKCLFSPSVMSVFDTSPEASSVTSFPPMATVGDHHTQLQTSITTGYQSESIPSKGMKRLSHPVIQINICPPVLSPTRVPPSPVHDSNSFLLSC